MFRSRGPARRHRLTAAAALLLFALTGCIRYHVDATLHADDTVSGTVVVGMQKSLMEAAKAGGASSDDPSSDLKKAKFSRGKAQVKPYDKDGYSGAQLIVDNVPRQEFLAAMNGNGSATGATGDVLRIDKASGRYTVSGTLDLSDSALGGDGGDSGDSIPPALRKQLLSSFDIQIALTFPGKVLEHNGTLKGTTVTWKAKAGEKTVMHAVAEATGAGGASDSKKAAWKSPAAIGGGAVALLAIGGLIAFLLVRRRGGGGGQPAYAGAGVGPGPAAPGGYQPETPQAAYTPPPYTPPPAPTATGPEQPSPWAAGSPPASPYAAGGPAGTSPYAAGSGSSPYAAGSGGSPYATGGGTDEPTRRVPGEDPDHPTQALPQQGQDPDDPDGPQPWQFGR